MTRPDWSTGLIARADAAEIGLSPCPAQPALGGQSRWKIGVSWDLAWYATNGHLWELSGVFEEFAIGAV